MGYEYKPISKTDTKIVIKCYGIFDYALMVIPAYKYKDSEKEKEQIRQECSSIFHDLFQKLIIIQRNVENKILNKFKLSQTLKGDLRNNKISSTDKFLADFESLAFKILDKCVEIEVVDMR